MTACLPATAWRESTELLDGVTFEGLHVRLGLGGCVDGPWPRQRDATGHRMGNGDARPARWHRDRALDRLGRFDFSRRRRFRIGDKC